MPRPPSAMYRALRHETDKQEWVSWLFGHVAPRYDLGNDLMSLGWHTRWKHRLVELADLKPEHRLLDLCCGTGDVTFMVAPRVGEVVGSDISEEMMAVAAQKRPKGCAARFVQADAGDLPFEDASFDRVTCSYAGRGLPDWPAALREVHRVLKPGGLFINLDFARPPNGAWDATYRGYMMASGAVLGTLLHGNPKTYMYIPASLAHYRGQRWLHTEMDAVGFQTQLIETRACLMAYNIGIK